MPIYKHVTNCTLSHTNEVNAPRLGKVTCSSSNSKNLMLIRHTLLLISLVILQDVFLSPTFSIDPLTPAEKVVLDS